MNHKLFSEHLSQTAAPLPLIQRTKTSALFPSLRVARVCWSPTSATSCHTATGCSCCGAAGQLPWGAGRKSPAWICPNLASQVRSGGQRSPDLFGSVQIHWIQPDPSRSHLNPHTCAHYITGLGTTSENAPSETVNAAPSGRETGVGQEIKAGRGLGDGGGESGGVSPQAGFEPPVASFPNEDGEWGRRPAAGNLPGGDGDRGPDAGEPPPLSNADTLDAPPPLPAAGGEQLSHSVGTSAIAPVSARVAAEAVVNFSTTSSGSAVVNRTAQCVTAEEPAGAIIVADERVVSEGGGALVQAESRQVRRGRVPSVVHFLVGWVTSKVLGRRVWHTWGV